MKTGLIALVILAVVGFVGIAMFMRIVSDDPIAWHVDPATTDRTGRPNDTLIAPPGTTAGTADRPSPIFEMKPRDLMFLVDSIAQPAGAKILAGSIDEMHVTYVVRSRVVGFPDYITVKAIDTGDGAGLIIWSRSRYGHSDLGVNAKRMDDWLQRLGP